MAQGITDRIKALQLQKDGLMSVAARKKKAFAQLEESEKTLESKRKALQQAQEALEEHQNQRRAKLQDGHVDLDTTLSAAVAWRPRIHARWAQMGHRRQ